MFFADLLIFCMTCLKMTCVLNMLWSPTNRKNVAACNCKDPINFRHSAIRFSILKQQYAAVAHFITLHTCRRRSHLCPPFLFQKNTQYMSIGSFSTFRIMFYESEKK